jgi:hypothetical protein
MEELLLKISDYLKSNTPKYLYNKRFIPNKSTVLYSGPYWDENEILQAIKTLLSGNWLVAGENVYKFERLFDIRKLYSKSFIKFSEEIKIFLYINVVLF